MRRAPILIALAGTVLFGLLMTHYRFFDMVIYHDAIRWWLSGGELYEYAAPVRGQLGFTYPPFAAFVLMPAAAVPAQLAGWLNAAGSVLALTVALGVVVGRSWLPMAVPLALCMEPVRQTLGLGQVNLWLFALVVLDLIVLRRTGSRWTGVGVGLATAIKITPGLFIVYLLVTGQWRAARTAAVTVAALTGCGLVLAPAETVRYFGDLLWRTERVGAAEAVANQSLAGLLARTATAPGDWWLPLCLLALAVGLRRAWLAHRAGDEAAALTLVGLTGNLISPMSWTHHLVFLPVAIYLLADAGLGGGGGLRDRDPMPLLAALAGYGLSVVSPIWFGSGALARDTFTLMLIGLVAALPRRPASEALRAGADPELRTVRV
jgi:hypothetical protein